jgi:hypothetical protein
MLRIGGNQQILTDKDAASCTRAYHERRQPIQITIQYTIRCLRHLRGNTAAKLNAWIVRKAGGAVTNVCNPANTGECNCCSENGQVMMVHQILQPHIALLTQSAKLIEIDAESVWANKPVEGNEQSLLDSIRLKSVTRKLPRLSLLTTDSGNVYSFD